MNPLDGRLGELNKIIKGREIASITGVSDWRSRNRRIGSCRKLIREICRIRGISDQRRGTGGIIT